MEAVNVERPRTCFKCRLVGNYQNNTILRIERGLYHESGIGVGLNILLKSSQIVSHDYVNPVPAMLNDSKIQRKGYISSSSSSSSFSTHGANGLIGLSVGLDGLLGLVSVVGLPGSPKLFQSTSLENLSLENLVSTRVGPLPILPILLTVSSMSPFSQISELS
jgi:hypothetical protein